MMDIFSPELLCDFYKLSHRKMYPPGTEVVYSTWTPRGSRLPGVDHVVAFGAQMALEKIDALFAEEFFCVPWVYIEARYKDLVRKSLGDQDPDVSHLKTLHDFGYLPILVKALPEGTVAPLRVPHLTIQNTDPRFFWLTNYLETLLSCQLWLPSTSATLAHKFRLLFDEAAKMTGADPGFVPFQGHDFSMRGMSSLESAASSGLGHLLSFVGTDTIPAIEAAEYYYDALETEELIGTSIPATEHSVQCAYGDDYEYFLNIINRVHPSGLVSIVSDGYDYWHVIGMVLRQLKDDILAREGKVVIRPDSGDPVKIVCGDEGGATLLEKQGTVQALWDIFGGTVNAAGFRVLDPHIGLIYGDAITYDRAAEILGRLAAMGYASSNVVFGIGSYTYQHKTRDSLGWAMKSTCAVINGKEIPIFKDPKTDDGVKKSQKGRVAVLNHDEGMCVWDGLSLNSVAPGDLLREVYLDGHFTVRETFTEIRKRLLTAR